MTIEQLGYIPPPPLPTNVTGELDLTQGFGPMDNGTAATRGYVPVPSGMPYFSNASQVSCSCSAHKLDSYPLSCKRRLPLLPAVQVLLTLPLLPRCFSRSLLARPCYAAVLCMH